MFGLFTTLLSQRNQARAYTQQSRLLGIAAQKTRIQGGAKADRIEQTAAKNQELSSYNLRKARENQRDSVGSARVMSGANGLTDEGTGNALVEDTMSVTDKNIANMAFSSSVVMANAWQTASDTRKSADINAEILESKAAQYRQAAKGTRQSMWLTGIAGAVGAAVGAYNTYQNNRDLADTEEAAPYLPSMLQGAEVFGNVANSFSPYTAALTGEFNNRRNNWGSFASIVSGTTPYNITGTSNLLFE